MTRQVYPVVGSAPTLVTPNGLSCGSVNQFVVIADADNLYNVRWCAIGDPTDWPIPATDDARSKQAGQQTLRSDLGVVTGISGNDFFGYVFQERGITKMTYVGGDVVFSFDTFEEGRGCWQYNRYVRVDDMTFFESEKGYHMIVNDEITDIGYGTVDDSNPPISASRQASVVSNETRSLICFGESRVVFNYKTGQWSLYSFGSNVDLYSLNSSTGYFGRVVYLTTGAGLTMDDSGTILTATLTTGAADLNPGGRVVVGGVRPIIDGGTMTVRVGIQDDLADAVTWSASTSLNTRSNMANFRSEGRYVRTEITIAGGFDTAIGADVEFAEQGRV